MDPKFCANPVKLTLDSEAWENKTKEIFCWASDEFFVLFLKASQDWQNRIFSFLVISSETARKRLLRRIYALKFLGLITSFLSWETLREFKREEVIDILVL